MRLRHSTKSTWICMLLGASLAGAACSRLEQPSQPLAQPPVVTPPTTIARMLFDTTTIVLEHLPVNARLHNVFRFTNNGPAKLMIESVKTSGGPCYCERYPRDSIAIGRRDSIVIECTLREPGHYLKSATVIANTEPRTHVLTIKARVGDR